MGGTPSCWQGMGELDLHKSINELSLDLHKSGNELGLVLHKSANELSLDLHEGLARNLDWVTTLTSHQSGILHSLIFLLYLFTEEYQYRITIGPDVWVRNFRSFLSHKSTTKQKMNETDIKLNLCKYALNW